MKEIEITCLTTSIRIPDLGLWLERGQTANVSLADASKSSDLSGAKKAGGVATREIHIAREVRKAGPRPTGRQIKTRKGPPPAPRPSGPTHAYSRPGTSAVPPGPLQVQGIVGIEHSELRQIIRTEVTGALKDAILQGRGPVSMGCTSPDREPVAEDLPAFIPTKIVPDGDESLGSQSDETEAASVDAAASKLKKTSTKKTRKKRASRGD